ncbi:MAG: DinB family protein [Gemmatimonadales bacterium]
MKIDLGSATAVLERTPGALRVLLTGVPEPLERGNEGGESWSPYDVLGHLIHGERTDWIPRMRIILESGKSRTFEPFDRFAQFEESSGRSLEDLLDDFEALRAESLAALAAFGLRPPDFEKTGRHPELGAVTLGELLATWVVHDLGHIAQIARVMARQLEGEVGPWRAYLPILAARPIG